MRLALRQKTTKMPTLGEDQVNVVLSKLSSTLTGMRFNLISKIVNLDNNVSLLLNIFISKAKLRWFGGLCQILN